MSRIDELISDLAPKGVAYRTLSELGTFVRGGGPQKKDFVDSGVGCIHYGQIYTHYGTSTSQTKSYVSAELAAKSRKARPGDVVVAVTGENDEDLGRAVAWLGDLPVAVSNHTLIFTSDLDPEYVSYFLRSASFRSQKQRITSGTKVRSISAQGLGAVIIPVPPLEVQREIVRILNQFTQLEAELEAELGGRIRQRHILSNRLPGATWISKNASQEFDRVRLGDLAFQHVEPVEIRPEDQYSNLGVRWYGEGVFEREAKLGRDMKASTLYRVRPGQLIYNRMFVTEGSFAIIDPAFASGLVSSEFPLFQLDHSRVLPEWLLLYLLDEFTLKRISAQTAGVERGSMKSRRRWKEEQFSAFEVALPPLDIQRELVGVVSASTALVTALSGELIARRKQYEYYRDKLLTFTELAA